MMLCASFKFKYSQTVLCLEILHFLNPKTVMNSIHKNKYSARLLAGFKKDIYDFVDEIKDVDVTNLPEPFLPIHGTEYGLLYPKIIFCGWETRNYRNLLSWVNSANEDIEDVIFWQEEFINHDFLKWRTNFGEDFWSCNLKILAKFHNIDDWRDLYKNPKMYEKILSSFVWANTDSIERYEVTAKGLGCKQSEYDKVKKASRRFDNLERLLDIFEPEIIIIEHWELDELWIHKNIKYKAEEVLDENLWYYEVEKTGCKIFWMPHPRGHNSKGINTKLLIDKIYNKIFKNNSNLF